MFVRDGRREESPPSPIVARDLRSSASANTHSKYSQFTKITIHSSAECRRKKGRKKFDSTRAETPARTHALNNCAETVAVARPYRSKRRVRIS